MSDERREIAAVDVLAQCALAMQQTASALLACIELCQQQGYFDNSPALVIEGEKQTEEALERLRSLGKRSRTVFGKKEPAGTPPADTTP